MRAWKTLLLLVAALAAGCSTSGTLPATPPAEAGTGVPSTEPILDGGGDVPSPPHGEDLCPPGPCNYQTGNGCGDGGLASCVPLPNTVGGLAPACEAAGNVPLG